MIDQHEKEQVVSHDFFALANSVFSNPDKDAAADLFPEFMQVFLAREFQILVKEVPDGQEGGGSVALGFEEVDGESAPVLIVGLDYPAMFAELPENNRVITMTGEHLVAVANKLRYVLHVLGEGEDDFFRLPSESMLMMHDLRSLEDSTTVPPAADPVIAPGFVRELYDYCTRQADIKRSWVGLLQVRGGTVTEVCMVLDCSNFHYDEHCQQLRLIANRWMAPNQMISFHDGASPPSMGDVDLLKTKPLYEHSHRQDWWSRLKRRLRPHPLVCVCRVVSE